MSVPFAEQVSAVAPLDGDVIDGSPRPHLKRPRKPAREPMDRSLTFFCSNPQCDHGTWSPVEQSRHMAREFWWAAEALVRLAPDSIEAVKLAGGVKLSEMTDEEGRKAVSERRKCLKERRDIPLHVRLRVYEYFRRSKQGEDWEGRLDPEEALQRRIAGRDGDPAERERILPPVGLRKRLRERIGLTQRQVGEELGVQAQSVLRWENGERLPPLETARAYATLLRYRPGDGLARCGVADFDDALGYLGSGENRRQLRAAAGLSRQELATRARVPARAICDWELTGRTPMGWNLIRYAQALGWHLDEGLPDLDREVLRHSERQDG